MKPTFKEFQASGRYVEDVSTAAKDTDEVRPGRVYMRDLCIESSNGSARGEWLLVLERGDYISDDLDMLERMLYDFAFGGA